MFRLGEAFVPILLSLILQGEASAVPRQSRPPRAHVDGGVVEGSYYDARSTDAVFKGIPFAAPPVGQLRWKPPAAVPAWRGIRDAKRFPSICSQRLDAPEYYAGLSARVGGRLPHQRPLATARIAST
jgi:hypothetical protein